MWRSKFGPVMEGEGGGSGGGSGGNAGGDNAAASGGGGGAGNTSTDWFSGFGNEEVKGYVKAKGFKDAESLASAYWSLEKTKGTPAERLLTLPSDDKPESWAPVYDRLGRPKDPEGYELAEIPGTDSEFQKWAKGTFHELGLTKKQAESLTKKWADTMTAAAQENEKQAKIKYQDQVAALKTKWGAASAQNAEVVDKLIQASGMTEEQASAMEKALGFDGFMELMHGMVKKFGIKFGEASFHTGGDGGGNSFGALSPGEAMARIKMLRDDAEWTAKFARGDVKARDEWERLHKYAYPA